MMVMDHESLKVLRHIRLLLFAISVMFAVVCLGLLFPELRVLWQTHRAAVLLAAGLLMAVPAALGALVAVCGWVLRQFECQSGHGSQS